MLYYATAGGRRHYELSDDQATVVGRLDYTSWLPQVARAVVNDGNSYELKPVGFWNRTLEVRRNGLPFAALRARLRGIDLDFEAGPALRYKRQGFLSPGYVLTDREDQVLATIRAAFSWRALAFQYTIDVRTGTYDPALNRVLPFLLVYCARYLRMRHAAAH